MEGLIYAETFNRNYSPTLFRKIKTSTEDELFLIQRQYFTFLHDGNLCSKCVVIIENTYGIEIGEQMVIDPIEEEVERKIIGNQKNWCSHCLINLFSLRN